MITDYFSMKGFQFGFLVGVNGHRSSAMQSSRSVQPYQAALSGLIKVAVQLIE